MDLINFFPLTLFLLYFWLNVVFSVCLLDLCLILSPPLPSSSAPPTMPHFNFSRIYSHVLIVFLQLQFCFAVLVWLFSWISGLNVSLPNAYVFLIVSQVPHTQGIPKTIGKAYIWGQRFEFKILTCNGMVNKVFDFSFLIKHSCETPFHQHIYPYNHSVPPVTAVTS